MQPWLDLPPEFSILPHPASPVSIIPKTSHVAGHMIPVEIWDQIVSHVFSTPTLFSLLPTCRRICDVVLRRLYARPLEWMGWHYHPLLAFERFVKMVLTHSTLDNPDTAFLRAKLGITTFGQQPTYTNYVALIQQWDLDFARFVFLLKVIDSSTSSSDSELPPFEWSSHVQQIHGALFWGMFEMHSMEHIRQIEVDYPDLDRLSTRIEELKCLERLSICDMSDNGCRLIVAGMENHPDEVLEGRFKAIAAFVELYIERHGNKRLREIELNRAGLGRKLQQAKLAIFAHLTPLKHPKELNLNNWHRLMAKVDETDLSHVKSIELQSSDPSLMVEWTCPPEAVLRRCRELEHLAIDATSQDMFAWAVDELHSDEAKRLRQHPSIQPPTPVPLKSISISAKDIHFPQVVHDAVVAFGQTITSMTTETTYEDPSAPEASELVSIDCGSLPSLRFLKMFIVDTLVLDTSFLARAPKLQIMSLGDNFSGYWPSNYDYHLPWDLPCLKFLRLDGLIATMFDPTSLRNMPYLVGIALKGTYQEVEHDMELRRDPFRYDPEDDETPGRCYIPQPDEDTGVLHNAASWSWRWFLPQLSMLELKGEPAYRFSFRFLRWCPVLTELKLHIDRQRRPLRLCEDLDGEDEAEVREARKATKKAMAEAALVKGDAMPNLKKPPKSLLDWYDIDIAAYGEPESTKAEDEEKKWAWELVAPRLQMLTMTGRWSISDEDIKRMLDNKAFPKLEELKLYRCKHYDTETLCKAAAQHVQLKELIISRQWTRTDQRRLKVMRVDPPKKWRQLPEASFLYGSHGGLMWDQRFWARTFGAAGGTFVKVKAKGRHFMLPKCAEWSRHMHLFISASKLDPKWGDKVVGKKEGEESNDVDDGEDEKENKEFYVSKAKDIEIDHVHDGQAACDGIASSITTADGDTIDSGLETASEKEGDESDDLDSLSNLVNCVPATSDASVHADPKEVDDELSPVLEPSTPIIPISSHDVENNDQDDDDDDDDYGSLPDLEDCPPVAAKANHEMQGTGMDEDDKAIPDLEDCMPTTAVTISTMSTITTAGADKTTNPEHQVS